MPPAVRTMRISSDLRRLADLREMVRSAAETAGADRTFVDDLALAVDETVTNVIVHGHAGAPGWIEVSVATVDGRFVVTIEDDAPPFDPSTVPTPDLSVPPGQRRPGGMGVHLTRLCADEISHAARPGGGNILTLVRTLKPRAKEDR